MLAANIQNQDMAKLRVVVFVSFTSVDQAGCIERQGLRKIGGLIHVITDNLAVLQLGQFDYLVYG
jgi:hypothetical protein